MSNTEPPRNNALDELLSRAVRDEIVTRQELVAVLPAGGNSDQQVDDLSNALAEIGVLVVDPEVDLLADVDEEPISEHESSAA